MTLGWLLTTEQWAATGSVLSGLAALIAACGAWWVASTKAPELLRTWRTQQQETARVEAAATALVATVRLLRQMEAVISPAVFEGEDVEPEREPHDPPMGAIPDAGRRRLGAALAERWRMAKESLQAFDAAHVDALPWLSDEALDLLDEVDRWIHTVRVRQQAWLTPGLHATASGVKFFDEGLGTAAKETLDRLSATTKVVLRRECRHEQLPKKAPSKKD